MPRGTSTIEYRRGIPKRFERMGEKTKMGYTPTFTDENQPESGTETASREGQLIRHRKNKRKKKKTRFTITFKRKLPEVGAVLETKDKNYREIFIAYKITCYNT